MFEWITDIVLWFARFIPKWDLLEPTDGGLRFSYGGRVKELEPGKIYWWWPIISKIATISIKRQTLTFGQRLTTDDGVSVQMSTVIVFVVNDVTKALMETADFDDTVGEVAQKVTIKPVMGREFCEIIDDLAKSNKMRNELTSNARSMLTPYGCEVLDSYVCDFTKTKVLSIEGDGMAFGYEDEDDD